jgi:hypothetical protein
MRRPRNTTRALMISVAVAASLIVAAQTLWDYA